MRKRTKQILVVSIAILFLIVGLIGLVLPILHGFVFLLIGIMLLSLYSPKIRDWLDIHTKKYPKLHTVVEKIDHWIEKIIGKP